MDTETFDRSTYLGFYGAGDPEEEYIQSMSGDIPENSNKSLFSHPIFTSPPKNLEEKLNYIHSLHSHSSNQLLSNLRTKSILLDTQRKNLEKQSIVIKNLSQELEIVNKLETCSIQIQNCAKLTWYYPIEPHPFITAENFSRSLYSLFPSPTNPKMHEISSISQLVKPFESELTFSSPLFSYISTLQPPHFHTMDPITLISNISIQNIDDETKKLIPLAFYSLFPWTFTNYSDLFKFNNVEIDSIFTQTPSKSLKNQPNSTFSTIFTSKETETKLSVTQSLTLLFFQCFSSKQYPQPQQQQQQQVNETDEFLHTANTPLFQQFSNLYNKLAEINPDLGSKIADIIGVRGLCSHISLLSSKQNQKNPFSRYTLASNPHQPSNMPIWPTFTGSHFMLEDTLIMIFSFLSAKSPFPVSRLLQLSFPPHFWHSLILLQHLGLWASLYYFFSLCGSNESNEIWLSLFPNINLLWSKSYSRFLSHTKTDTNTQSFYNASLLYAIQPWILIDIYHTSSTLFENDILHGNDINQPTPTPKEFANLICMHE